MKVVATEANNEHPLTQYPKQKVHIAELCS